MIDGTALIFINCGFLVEDQLVETCEGVNNEIETVLGSIAWVYIDNLPAKNVVYLNKNQYTPADQGLALGRDNNLKWNVVKPTLINNFSELISWTLTPHHTIIPQIFMVGLKASNIFQLKNIFNLGLWYSITA